MSQKWSNGYTAMYEKRNLLHRRGKLAFKVVKIDGAELVVTKVVPVDVESDISDESDESIN
jgi:hypothetical protein